MRRNCFRHHPVTTPDGTVVCYGCGFTKIPTKVDGDMDDPWVRDPYVNPDYDPDFALDDLETL